MCGRKLSSKTAIIHLGNRKALTNLTSLNIFYYNHWGDSSSLN